MSIGGSSGKESSNTQPWDQQIPYLVKGFEDTQNLYDTGQLAPTYYPGQTVAGLSDSTRLAGQAVRSISGAGAPGVYTAANDIQGISSGNAMDNPGNSYYQNFASGGDAASMLTAATAGGSYLNSNPFLDAMYGKAAKGVTRGYEDAASGINSVFAKGGRFGSNAHYSAEGRNEENLATGLGDLATSIYGGNYANERGLMENAQGRLADIGLAGASGLSGNYNAGVGQRLQAAGLAPSLEAAKYIGADALKEFGEYKDAYNQDVVNSEVDRYNATANQPLQALQQYMSLISGDYGSSTTGKSSNLGFGLKILG